MKRKVETSSSRHGKKRSSSGRRSAYLTSNSHIMIKQTDVKPGDTVYYHMLPWEEPERGIVSSLCPDPNFIFVRYTKGDTAARTSCFYLFKERPHKKDDRESTEEPEGVTRAKQLRI